jgi:hypothetical protein
VGTIRFAPMLLAKSQAQRGRTEFAELAGQRLKKDRIRHRQLF